MCFGPIYVAWFAAIFIAAPIERAHHHRLVDAAMAVEAGMTPEEVVSLIGPPNAKYGERTGLVLWLKGPRPKQWMYGTTLNLDYVVVPKLPTPNPFPVNLRIAEYAEEDIVIDWSPSDTVSAIRRPEFDLPKIAFEMLEAVEFLEVVLRHFVFVK